MCKFDNIKQVGIFYCRPETRGSFIVDLDYLEVAKHYFHITQKMGNTNSSLEFHKGFNFLN